MVKAIKIAKAGKNAETSTDPNDFIFHSGYNTFKIVLEGLLTSQSVTADGTTFTVAHGQSGIPTVYAFAKFPDGYVSGPNSKERAENASPVDRYWRVETDATNVSFIFYKGTTANYSVNIKYYVFEAPL